MSTDSLLDRYVRLKTPPCIAEEIDGETVIINLDTGSYYNLQNKSSRIWQALNDGILPRQLIQTNAWDAEAAHHLDKFLATALAEGIVEAAAEAPTSTGQAPKIALDNPETDISIAVFTDMQELLGLDPIHETDAVSGWPNKP